ncbi:MAG: hypothetical protein U0K81_05120 [Paludibacteraceae bacterium]|nr:hypothetical protein [Paludibacteraceae bacterium]
MQDYESRHSGEEIDDILDDVANKVDKVEGKGLSSEDFTSAEKRKLAGLENYDDTALRKGLSTMQNSVVEVRESLDEVAALINDINTDIADLDAIRRGAEKGDTSVQGVVVNNKQLTPDSKGNISLPKILAETDIANMGFTKNKGTVTGVMVNGESKSPNSAGVVDLGTIGGGGSVDLSNYYTKEDIIPAESIGVLSNAAKGSATSNPIVGNRIPYLKADAFAFLNPDEYTIEYSVDGVDWEKADSNTIYSRSLFAGYNFYNSVPIDPSQRQFQVGSKIRITMYPKNARNAHIDVIAINMYCNGRTFDIEGEYCAKSNDTPQWQSMQRTVSSNANGVVYFQYNNKFAFEAYPRWGIRLTFTITKNTAYSSRIQGIMGYGNICSEIAPSVSTAPYTLGTLWFWDYLKNITFPAAISATSLSLTGGNRANLLRGNGEQIAPTALTLDFTQLDWYKANTQSISNGMWQVLAPYIPTTKGNRLAFLSDEEFKVEYSTDSGVTWSEMEKTSTMRNVFSGRNNGNITVKSTTTDQMRITITPNRNRYCLIDFFYFWVGSPSDGNTLMDVEFSTGNAPDTWSLHVKDVDLRGLTGANMVKYKRLFAHGSTGVANVRFTIRNTKDHNTNTTIQGISGYGTKVWGNMSNMFLTGDIYSWDIDQNALFPSKIKEGDKWLGEKYALKSEVEVQSDWLEDNSNSNAFIKNKPTMPTAIAPVTEVIVEYSLPSTLLPNVIHEVAVGLGPFIMPPLYQGDSMTRNVYKMVFVAPESSAITFPYSVCWRDGVAPNWSNSGDVVELTFTTMAEVTTILGEWKLYKL